MVNFTLRGCRSGDRRRVASFGKLHRVEPGIETVAGEQLLMTASLDDMSPVDDAYQVGALHGGQPMRDHDGRAPTHQRPQSRLYLPLRFAVEGRCGLVEQQDRCVL